ECRNCGAGEFSTSANFCTKCGAMLQEPAAASGHYAMNVVMLLAGFFLYLWASHHSPYDLNPMMLLEPGAYFLKEPVYSLILVVAAGLALFGLAGIAFKLARGRA